MYFFIPVAIVTFLPIDDQTPVYLMFRSTDKEYLPITGIVQFNKLSAKLIFGADR